MRAAYKDKAEVTDALSTHAYVLNQNAVIRYYDPRIAAQIEGGSYKNGLINTSRRTLKSSPFRGDVK